MKTLSIKPAGHSAAKPSRAPYTSLLQPFKSTSKTKVLKILPVRCNLLQKEQVLNNRYESSQKSEKPNRSEWCGLMFDRFGNKGTYVTVTVKE